MKDNIKESVDKCWDYEAKSNIVGFFNLLLKVDKRVNPHIYKKGIYKERKVKT